MIMNLFESWFDVYIREQRYCCYIKKLFSRAFIRVVPMKTIYQILD